MPQFAITNKLVADTEFFFLLLLSLSSLCTPALSALQVGMRYMVLGGGIAGVCCVEELCKLCPQDSVLLVSNGNALKVITAWTAGPVPCPHKCNYTLTHMQGVGKVVRFTDKIEDFESKPVWATLTASPCQAGGYHKRSRDI